MTDEDDDDSPIRGEVRLVGHRRVSHGLYLRRTRRTDDRRGVAARPARLPAGPAREGACSPTSPLRALLGWQLPKLPEQVPVFAAVDGGPATAAPARAHLLAAGAPRPGPARPGGLPVDAPEEILLRAARDLGRARPGHHDRLGAPPRSPRRRPDARACSRASVPAYGCSGSPTTLSTDRAESGGETVPADLPRGHRRSRSSRRSSSSTTTGCFLGRADLLVTGTCSVHEYDGEHHRGKVQHRTDLRRERGWRGTPYVRRGFVARRPGQPPAGGDARARPRPRPATRPGTAAALATARRELAVLRAGPRAGDEPVAPSGRHHRLVTNCMIRAVISCGW